MYGEYTSAQYGFTLVELAIVMIIVGLLIGGILKGQELVANSRITGTIRMITSIQAVATSFRDMYGALPGDVIAAKVPGCPSDATCEGGDETGAVGAFPGEDLYVWSTRLSYSGHAREAFQFWKHLALTDMISGVNSAADPANAAWGETNPMTPFGGGFEFYYDGRMNSGAGVQGSGGHIMRISANGVGGTGTVQGLLSPTQSAVIDKKLDDGNASAGYIFADYGVISGNSNRCRNADDTYREDNVSGYCMLFIRAFR